jgi:Zn-dependent M28 family amino/carboxypeptidase
MGKTIRLFLIAGAAGLSIPAAAAAQASGYATTAADRIDRDIRYLAADAREGRGVGTAGLDSAAHYVAAAFRTAGLEPGGTDGYLQPFVIDPTAPAAAHAGVGHARVANVVAIKPGAGALAGQVVVIGAHYDHLGYGGFGSLDPDSVHVVHNGADDNASGTAAMLEAARVLAARRGANARTLVFVAFTGEELGLIGSSYYVSHSVRPNDSTFAMINLDMVGRLGSKKLAVFGAETATEFDAILDTVNTSYGFSLSASGDGYGRSDQQSFFTAKIPVLHFFSGTHEDYHRTTDDADKIDLDGAARIADFVADLAWDLATRTEPLTFVDAAPPQTTTSGGYGAYLGTIPDMTESPDGVRLTGVRAGSPAEAAGIQAGDVLVKLGDNEIRDLYQMTDALRAYQPGQTVPVHVRRDGEIVELTVTLGRRGG